MNGTLLSFPRFTQHTASPLDGLQSTVGKGEVFNHVNTNDYMWSGEDDRVVRQTIHFDVPFSSLPMVSVGVTAIDASRAQNQRYHLRTENIIAFGFDLVFVTWDDTKIARASASWTATGSQKLKMRSVEDIETLF